MFRARGGPSRQHFAKYRNRRFATIFLRANIGNSTRAYVLRDEIVAREMKKQGGNLGFWFFNKLESEFVTLLLVRYIHKSPNLSLRLSNPCKNGGRDKTVFVLITIDF